MFSQYFGQYLLNKGLLSAQQLRDALEHEKNTKVKLGVLAMNAGYMSAEQVEIVYRQQAKVDEKFGEIAVKTGYLSESQLKKLLSTQKQGHLVLCQYIADKGYMTLSQLDATMKEYMDSRNLNIRNLDDLNLEKLMNSYLNFGDTLWHKIYWEYVSLLLRNCMRFINDVPVVQVERVDETYYAEWMVSQRIFGKFSMFTSFASNSLDALKHLAELFNKDTYSSFDEYAQDGISEFLNLHNGIFLVNISNNGVVLDMAPQNFSTGVKLDELPECFKITLTWIWGTVDMVIY